MGVGFSPSAFLRRRVFLHAASLSTPPRLFKFMRSGRLVHDGLPQNRPAETAAGPKPP